MNLMERVERELLETSPRKRRLLIGRMKKVKPASVETFEFDYQIKCLRSILAKIERFLNLPQTIVRLMVFFQKRFFNWFFSRSIKDFIENLKDDFKPINAERKVLKVESNQY